LGGVQGAGFQGRGNRWLKQVGFNEAHFFYLRMDMSTSLESKIEELLQPLIEAEGYDLVLAEYLSGSKILRLFVDKEGGISLEDCGTVSHLVSDVLDADGVMQGIDGAYKLEVSSPGLDRPLVRPKDFIRFVGSEAKITTAMAVDGRRRFLGELKEANEDGICIVSAGQTWPIAYENIEKARLVPTF